MPNISLNKCFNSFDMSVALSQANSVYVSQSPDTGVRIFFSFGGLLSNISDRLPCYFFTLH